MKLTNRYNLPSAIVNAIQNDPYPTTGTGDLSITRLIDAPQIAALKRQHAHDIEEDAADRLWALMGQAIHVVLERAEEEALTEERLFTEIEGWTISGQIDRMTYEKGTMVIQDYKLTTTASVKKGYRREWENQLNALACLAQRNGYPITRLEVIALLRDWTPAQAGKGDYPPAAIVTIPIPLWPPEQAATYLKSRVQQHQAAAAGNPPPCNEAERWQHPATYAVKKVGRKTAIKIFENRQEAVEALLDLQRATDQPEIYSIEEREGEAIRCQSYCPVRAFCRQSQMVSN